MSGHSKFANIKHKKERNDAAKGKIFTVIGRELAVAVKEGGPDPANNSKLRDGIAKAKRTICRTIPSIVVSRKQPEMQTLSITRILHMRDMARMASLSS